MDKITTNQLQHKVDYIAKMLSRPTIGWKKVDGQNIANIGYLFIDHYNPGDNPYQFKLAELMNESGGEHDWTNYRMTRKEFYAYLTGICDGLDHAKSEINSQVDKLLAFARR